MPRMGGQGCVLLVNGLVEDVVTADVLFAVFGVYGDVQRVKIMWKNKSMGLVELSNPQQSMKAKKFLDGIELYGSPLSISVSKHASITVPTGSNYEPSNLTKDFSGSPMHRFKRSGSNNEKHVCAPSAGLHLSNLPQTVTPQEITDFFGEFKLVAEPRIFGNGSKKMAIITMASLADSMHALITMHGSDFQNNQLRITFAHLRPQWQNQSQQASTEAPAPM